MILQLCFTLLLKFVRIVLIGCNIYTGGTVFVSFLYHLSNNSTSAGTSRIHSRIMSSSFASIIVGSGRYPYFCPKNTCREMILTNSECLGSVILFRTWNLLCSFYWLLVPLLVSLRNGFYISMVISLDAEHVALLFVGVRELCIYFLIECLKRA